MIVASWIELSSPSLASGYMANSAEGLEVGLEEGCEGFRVGLEEGYEVLSQDGIAEGIAVGNDVGM